MLLITDKTGSERGTHGETSEWTHEEAIPADRPRNMIASVSARLLNLAHKQGEQFQLVLMRYGLERLLYRLGCSPYAGEFVVKGAMLFTLWAVQPELENAEDKLGQTPSAHRFQRPHRATHDLDLLDFGPIDLARLAQTFRSLCELSVDEDDGLAFCADTVRVAPIREDQEYGGIRVHFLALLGKARIPLQVDVGFGDVVTPTPSAATFPTLLINLPSPHVRVYPRETVVAETFEALARLGMPNTRLKDYYDLWTLANRFSFDGWLLSAAIRATFSRRGAALPEMGEEPVGLTPSFSDNRAKQTQWASFLRKGQLTEDPAPDLPGVLVVLRAFLLPPCTALARGEAFSAYWLPGGPWVQGECPPDAAIS